MKLLPFLRELSRGQRWQVGGLLGALLALSWINFKASSVDAAQHQRYLVDLYAFEELSARLDAEVLASQQGLVTHFDGLTRLAAQVRETAGRLTSPPQYLLADDLAQLIAKSRALDDDLAAKLDGIESFKRQLSRLRNSQAWFPTAVDGMLADPNDFREPQVVRALAHYANRVMRFLRAPDASGREEIEAARRQVLALPLSSVERERIGNLVQHGDLLAAEWPELFQQLVALRDPQYSAQRRQLHDLFEQSHARSVIAAGRYRNALYGLSLLLAAWLAALFVYFLRANRALDRAHAEINARYRELLAAQKQLKLHATVFENAQEGITLTAPDKTILDVNPAFARITGYARAEAIGQTPRLLKSGRHDEGFYRAMWDSIGTSGHWQGEIWNRNKAGNVYPELLSVTAVKDESGAVSHYIGIFTDISRLKEQERQLTRLAYFDVLTGLPNRTLLIDRATQVMAQTRRMDRLLAVCLLDLDGFKPINDTYGHETGDRVLVELGQRMQGQLRSGDTVARLGGDEFVLLLPDLDSPAACFEVLQRIQIQIAQPFAFLPEAVAVTASIGITFYPTDDADADTLLRHADQAMYLAKQAGKQRFQLFDVALDQSLRTLYDQRARLHQALAAGEFALFYQPKVDMRRGQVIGAEALLRWQHPERGLVAPMEFLPMIEHDDLIVRIGDWAIETALAQMEAWHAQGIEIDVSVNVAALQLQAPDFTAKLNSTLARHPDVARHLELEVLETAALEDVVHTTQVIDACHAFGLRIALDDFGTGYSSLGYLKRLPIDVIKIDQGFIREILADPDSLVIVRGIIGLADAFQHALIAEGVETAEHGRLLLQLGCDHAQGYGIASPMPADELAAWMRQWHPAPEWDAYRPLEWSEADYPLLVAEVASRHWQTEIEKACTEGRAPPSEHLGDWQVCILGTWYYGRGAQTLGKTPEFAAIEAPHRRIHELAEEIATALRAGDRAAASTRLPAFRAACAETLAALRALQIAAGRPRRK